MAYLFKYYAPLYDQFMKHFQLDSNQAIIDSLGSVQGKRILDLGGGTGTLGELLHNKGARVIIVDPSVQMTKIAKEKNQDFIIYNTTLQSVQKVFLEEPVDIVIIRDTLHHIKEQAEVIKLVWSCLKPKGKLLIWEFNWKSIKTKMIWLFETLCFEKCSMFTKEKLLKLCNPYFIEERILDTNDFEMLYIGEKGEACEKAKAIN